MRLVKRWACDGTRGFPKGIGAAEEQIIIDLAHDNGAFFLVAQAGAKEGSVIAVDAAGYKKVR